MERTLAHYRLELEIGRGGMGVVHAAVDTKLGRRVAIKILPPEAIADPERRRRFMVEARAASALNHPNIAHIYELVDIPPEGGNYTEGGNHTEGGSYALVMELVDGTPLDRIIANGPVAITTAIDYATQVAGALEAAHAAGIIHRDIKPANIIIARDGRAKVLDFGLAKLVERAGDTDATVTSAATRLGVILGTAAYMSPEQAQGQPIDARSDIFSFGTVLYEMLAGRRPFGGDTQITAITSILHDTPAPLTNVPRAVDAIVRRALQKTPEARYPDAGAMRTDLAEALRRLTAPRESVWRRPAIVVPAGLALAAVLAFGTWQTVQARGVRWARTEALPQLEGVTGTQRTIQAVRLARTAEKYVPEEIARLRELWTRANVTTEPAGATIELRNYSDLKGAWESFGATPGHLVVPFAYYRFRLTKPGYAPVELSMEPHDLAIPLTAESATPDGMVRVPGGPYTRGAIRAAALPDFWIDRLEVTNRDYKKFVDAGAYANPKHWKEPFVEIDGGGRTLTFAEAMTRFRDKIGRPGPATWELGTYPEGQADFPVGGISWFEAAAYAEFAGKRLPTIYHWLKASGVDEIYSDILTLSNFDGKGPTRAGERAGLGPFGTLDTAGNVKEWCANAVTGGAKRYILGGAWNEPSYRFVDPEGRDPWERGPTFGVRLITNAGAADASLDAPVGAVRPDPKTMVPVADAELALLQRVYGYDKTPLDARVTAVDERSPNWTKVTLSFAAAYGGERVPAYLFLPKHVRPPYQTIVFFPSAQSRYTPSSANLDLMEFGFLVRSGRAVIYPVYQNTFERRRDAPPTGMGPNAYRDMYVQWAKDFFRAVDYLQTRQDIDMTRLGYYAVSMGSYFAPIPLALEPRIKTAALVAGGLRATSLPEVMPTNFAPKVTQPVLLVNGRDDFSASMAVQERFMELLGTPPEKRRLASLDGGHVPNDWNQVIKEVLDWFDRWLGPVN